MANRIKSGFVMVENAFIKEGYGAKVGGNATLVYLAIATYAHNETRECFPSTERLMKDTGLTKPTVLKAVKKLIEVGVIRLVKKGGLNSGSNRYYLPVNLGSLDGNDAKPTTTAFDKSGNTTPIGDARATTIVEVVEDAQDATQEEVIVEDENVLTVSRVYQAAISHNYAGFLRRFPNLKDFEEDIAASIGLFGTELEEELQQRLGNMYVYR